MATIIFKTALTLGFQAFRDLIDASLPESKVQLVRRAVLTHGDIEGIRTLKVRRVGQSVWVDVDVFVDGRKTVREGHEITRALRLALHRRFRQIQEVTISFTCRENPKKARPRRWLLQRTPRRTDKKERTLAQLR